MRTKVEINPALEATLALAVPLWIEKIKSERWTNERRRDRSHECGQYIAEHGDELQFGGKKGAAAKAFNHLAEGLALLSFAPGGVRFGSLHWVTKTVPPPPV